MMIRNRNFKGFYFVLILIGWAGCKPKPQIEAGISRQLATERKALITDITYNLHFDIPESKDAPIEATETIQFELSEVPDQLLIDFNVDASHIHSIVANDKPLNIRHEKEHIVIDDELNAGENKIEIGFRAGDMSLNRNADYLYTLFVPDRASTCFPVFDQPDLKARYQLTLDLPVNWRGLTNGSALRVDTLEEKKRIFFNQSDPLSSYQFAFAAGAFKQASSKHMNMFYRETDENKVKGNIEQIFELHEQAISWLETYTGIPYPFEKMDFALMPSFQYGGMEHPGSIFYRESSLMLDPSASVNMQLRRASLIAHETAHMWFGNLVTMKWFNDVWLKEVFANFMAAKIVNPGFPQINHELRFVMAHYPSAYEVDRSSGSHPIQQELENLKNAGTLYGAIIYQKAPIMMRNLEKLVGEEAFQLGLQEYLKTYSYSNASWDDLISVVKKYTDQDLDVWNQAWIKTAGMPEVQEAASSARLAISVANDERGIIWPQSFSYLVRGTTSEQRIDVDWLDGRSVVVDIKEQENRIIIPNYSGNGYGYFKTDQNSLEFMLRYVSGFDDPLVRATIWLALWEAFVNHELAPDEMLSNLSLTLQKEKDPLLLEYLCDRLTTVYWQFLSPQHRATFSAPLENHLFDLIALDNDASRKRTLYQCYRSVATTPVAVQNLKKFWGKQMTLGLEFSERDYMALAYEIAVRLPAESEITLKEQRSRIENPDRQQEFHFVSQALAQTEESRARFFESLRDPANREHEPWVLEALRWLHHPLRASTSVQYIKPSLEMIEEIQLTGDIFFPKGWLDATLAEYQSKLAANAVTQYLAAHPELPDYLRNKVLQSADLLMRASEVVEISPEKQ